MSAYPPQHDGIPPYQQPAMAGGMPGYGAVATTAYAGFWRRFVALLIDGILLGIVGGILSAVLGLGAGTAEGGSAAFNFGTGGTLLNVVLDLIYFTLMIGLLGKTVGGMALGIKVVPVDGGAVGIGKALIRAIVAYISGFVLLIGYLWMLWDGKKQTWHDKAAGTIVVRG